MIFGIKIQNMSFKNGCSWFLKSFSFLGKYLFILANANE